MKVIIPLAGYGTPNPLVHVAGRPSLDFVLDALAPLPVEELIFIVDRMDGHIENHVRENYSQYKSRFIEQKVMRGQADTIALAAQYVQGDLVTLFADTIFEADLSVLNNLTDADGAIVVAEVPDPSRFGIAVVGQDGYVSEMAEERRRPESNLGVMGLCYFKDSRWLFHAIETLMESGRDVKGDYYLADAIQVMIDEGAKFRAYPVTAWEDIGTPDGLLNANRSLLGKMDRHTEPYTLGTSLIIPPALVSPNATVVNSIIGPNASISDGASVCDAIIKNSVVGPHAKVNDAILSGAMIGERAAFEGSYQSLNIGDDTAARMTGATDAEIDETFK